MYRSKLIFHLARRATKTPCSKKQSINQLSLVMYVSKQMHPFAMISPSRLSFEWPWTVGRSKYERTMSEKVEKDGASVGTTFQSTLDQKCTKSWTRECTVDLKVGIRINGDGLWAKDDPRSPKDQRFFRLFEFPNEGVRKNLE